MQRFWLFACVGNLLAPFCMHSGVVHNWKIISWEYLSRYIRHFFEGDPVHISLNMHTWARWVYQLFRARHFSPPSLSRNEAEILTVTDLKIELWYRGPADTSVPPITSEAQLPIINQSIKCYLYSPYSQTTVRLIGLKQGVTSSALNPQQE